MNFLLAILFAATAAASETAGTAKVTASTAFYDHNEGYAFFSGNVFVDDEQYKLHADRAYVFMSGTNELNRIVALGHVAVTNDTKRAYGAKVSYYRKSGMIVLDAGEDTPAEVRDETKEGERIVRGKKIKFWTATKQVEVQEAWINGQRPDASSKGVKDLLGR